MAQRCNTSLVFAKPMEIYTISTYLTTLPEQNDRHWRTTIHRWCRCHCFRM